ncbi:MAG: MlaE family lipid ABC transporter permease subunit [Alphaproteobacteria bacterium]|nr:MlaE family lipid ABC transporter permease subunit [Alphaproteobacteria bacterium]
MSTDAGTAHDIGTVDSRLDGDLWRIVLAGQWTVAAATGIDRALKSLPSATQNRVAIDMAQVSALDTAGAWLVWRTIAALNDQGVETELVAAQPAHTSLIDTVARNAVPCPDPPRRRNAFIAMVERVGAATFAALYEARDLLNFLGLVVIVLARSIVRPHRIRLTPLIFHIEQSGLNAIPIVGLISFLIGVVLAFQGAEQLAKFGVEIFTVNIVASGVLREMGVLLTAIMLAGRSGSAFTAQIGTMKVNEEIDAMRTIGLDPMEVLVLPRMWALVICLPLLAFFANVMGLLGGAIMATTALDITFFQFARQLASATTLWTFWIGIIKAPIFGFIIGLVGCYEGLRVSGSAESVGRLTTRAVVESIFLVIILDALFSILFAELGI